MPDYSMTSNDLHVKSGMKFDAVVSPVRKPIGGHIVAQPSKNYTTRYLLAAGLAHGESLVLNCATSADSVAMQRCLKQFGAELQCMQGEDAGDAVHVTGCDGNPHLENIEPVNVGNAGAVLRFLLAVGAMLPEVTFETDHPKSLGTRPNADLLEALHQLGCSTESTSGRLPITIRGGKLHGGDVNISGALSSQFISGLLFLAPMIGESVHITVKDSLVSRAPIRQTLEVQAKAGIDVTASDDLMHFTVQPSVYRAGNYRVNGDWPGSAALLAAAAVTGGDLIIDELFNDEQGEKAAGDVLKQMGADFHFLTNGTGVRLISTGNLSAVEFDGDLATDAVLALMGAACFAKGKTRFFNVSNLRIKECDRITEPIRELRKIGVKCWEGRELNDPDPDAIIIEGSPDGYEGGVTVDGRDDHRVIMLLSIVALRSRKPLRILRAHQVAKSYPEYFNHLAALGGCIKFEEQSQ